MPRAPNFDSATGGLGLSGHTRSKPVGADVVVAYDVDVSDGLDAALLGGALVSTPLDPDDELIFVQGRAYVCPLILVANVALTVYSIYLNGWKVEPLDRNPMVGPSFEVRPPHSARPARGQRQAQR